jgi:hypothetical protein
MLAMTLGLVIQSTPINVESPGIRLVNLIPKLAAEARLALSVVPALENDVVAIRTMGRPWGEVKANLAKILNATWEEKDGRFILTQTPEQLKAERDYQLQSMLADIKERFATIKKFYSAKAWTETEFNLWFDQHGKKPSPEVGRQARYAMNLEKRRSSPKGRLVARILEQIKPESLIPKDLDWEKHIYATDRLVLHDYLPLDLGPALRLFREEQTMLSDRSQAESDKPEKLAAGATILVLNVRNLFTINIDLYDSEGSPSDYVFDFERDLVETSYEKPRATPALSKLWADATSFVSPEPGRRSTLDENQVIFSVEKLRKLLGNALVDDPLGLIGGADWMQLGLESNRPMIAFLSDLEARPVSERAPPGRSQAIRLPDEKWILGSQKDKFRIRRNRADRAEISKFAPYVIQTGLSKSLNGVAGVFERATVEYLTNSSKWFWMAELSDLDFDGQVGDDDYGLLPLLGALDTNERQALLSGRSLPLSGLNENARKYFREDIFRSDRLLVHFDKRIAPVAFPNVDRGFVLSARTKPTLGYVVSYFDEASKISVDKDCSEDDLAVMVAAKDFGGAPASAVRIATGANTELALSITYGAKKVESSFHGSMTVIGKRLLLSEMDKGLLERLRVRGEQIIKENDGG